MPTAPFTRSEVRVVPYDPGWVGRFDAIRERVWPALCDIAVAIEHVGSTSVPGLAAKPVIDVDVVVASAAALASCVARLAPVGYVHRGELGIAGRHAFSRPVGSLPHNLYVCVRGSIGLRNHLALRDHLRAHPVDAAAYGALKVQLAQTHAGDIDRYCEAKTEFIVAILARCGIEAGSLDEVVQSNRVPTR